MEIALTNHQDVTEPDHGASCRAGTGREHGISIRSTEHACVGERGEFFLLEELNENPPSRPNPGVIFPPGEYGPVAQKTEGYLGLRPVGIPKRGQRAGLPVRLREILPAFPPVSGTRTGTIKNPPGFIPVLSPGSGPIAGTTSNSCGSSPILSVESGQKSGTAISPECMSVPFPGSFNKAPKNPFIIASGVLCKGEMTPVLHPDPVMAPDVPDEEDPYDALNFSERGQQERFAVRLTHKIERLSRRLTVFEKRRRA